MQPDMSEFFESVNTSVLRRAALRALKAPSIHNTQPWRFVVRDERLDICIDPERRLEVLDPRGRQLLMSCGCALLNARVAIESAGYEADITRFSTPGRRNVLARLRVGPARPRGRSAALDAAIDRRHTNRRQYLGEPVSDAEAAHLMKIARSEGVDLVRVTTSDHRSLLSELLTRADRLETEDPAYLKELLDWTTADPQRPDGVQAASIPYVGPGAARVVGSPVRQFDLRAMGWLPAASRLADECVLVLCTETDDPEGWLRAGEALELVWLELTLAGLWASPIGQVIEVAGTNERLRAGLALTGHPQLVLRVGRAPDAPPSRRRTRWDVIAEP